MNISLTPELEAMISRKVKSGMYGSASEVVRESLRRMFKEEESTQQVINEEQRQQMEDLRREVLKGVEQIRNGEGISVPLDQLDDFFGEIIERGKKRLEEKEEQLMRIVDFSPLAKQDLEDIIVYFSEYNVPAAQKTLKKLKQKFNLLAENPQMGVLRDNYILGIRTFPYKDYLIFYFPTENGIEVYRVIRGARNIDDLFDELIEGLKP